MQFSFMTDRSLLIILKHYLTMAKKKKKKRDNKHELVSVSEYGAPVECLLTLSNHPVLTTIRFCRISTFLSII